MAGETHCEYCLSQQQTGPTTGDDCPGVVEPIPMVLHCPRCGAQHIDKPEPERGWTNPPHKSHLCHGCKLIWRPADVPTVGVEFIATVGEHDHARIVWTEPESGEFVERLVSSLSCAGFDSDAIHERLLPIFGGYISEIKDRIRALLAAPARAPRRREATHERRG